MNIPLRTCQIPLRQIVAHLSGLGTSGTPLLQCEASGTLAKLATNRYVRPLRLNISVPRTYHGLSGIADHRKSSVLNQASCA